MVRWQRPDSPFQSIEPFDARRGTLALVVVAGCAAAEDADSSVGSSAASITRASIAPGTSNDYFVADSTTRLRLRTDVTVVREPADGPTTFALRRAGGGGGRGGAGFIVECTCAGGCWGGCLGAIGPGELSCTGSCQGSSQTDQMCPSSACQRRFGLPVTTGGGAIAR